MSSSPSGASSGGASSGGASSDGASPGGASSGGASSGGASKTSGRASKTSGRASKTSGGASKTSGRASKTSGRASKTSGGASSGGASPEEIADKIKNLQFTDSESRMSMLTWQQAPEVRMLWLALLVKLMLNLGDVTVLDAFGNVGGDAVMMALIGIQSITSIELNVSRFECMRRNIASLGLENIINPICENFMAWLLKDVKPGTKFNVVYLDPPWFPGNGPHKATKTYKDLYIVVDGSEIVSVFDVITRIFEMGLTDTIVLKIPPNSKFEQLSEEMKKTSTPVRGGSNYPQYRWVVINIDAYLEHLKSLQREM